MLAYLQRKRVAVTHVYRFPPPLAVTSTKHRTPVSFSLSPSHFHPLPFALVLSVAPYVLMFPPPDAASGVKPLATHSNIVRHLPAAVQTAAHPLTIPALTPPPARTVLVPIPPPTPLVPHSSMKRQSNISWPPIKSNGVKPPSVLESLNPPKPLMPMSLPTHPHVPSLPSSPLPSVHPLVLPTPPTS